MSSDELRIERGSTNVFADLGVPEAESRLLKADLVTRIDAIVRHRSSRERAAAFPGLSEPDLSRLLRGHFAGWSLERMLRLLTALGRDVDIVIREPCSRRPGRIRVKAT